MVEEKNLLQIVKNFLFSVLNKQFFVFLFFLLLSAVFWFILTLNETYEKELKIPVRFVNVPRNVVITSAAVDTIRVTVRDKGWILFSYLYGEKRHELNLNYKNYDRGNGGGIVSNSEVKRLLEQLFEGSSKVTAIKPERLEFFYNNGERKRVPVKWTGRVIPEQLYFISQVEYTPDSVDVYAPKDKLDSIRYVNSEPLNYVGFHDTLTVDCRLAHDTDVKVMPDHVSISFFTDVLTEENISVPVQCINLPKGKVLRTFPAKVQVHFVAGAGMIRSLHPEDFVVVADYAEIAEKHSDKCNLYLNTVPQGISRAKLNTKQVDYLIEEEEENEN